MKERGEKIAVLTAYDYPSALITEAAGVDAILVGDSLGMVVLGYETTLPVTMDDMLHHVKAVTRAAKRALVIADMPFMSYQIGPEDGLRNAGRFMQEGGASAVKLEGGGRTVETVARITGAGIPVMGHLGMQPQSVHQVGGYRAQGREEEAARRIMSDAKALEDAGAFAVVLEVVPMGLAKEITAALRIPTIGIGAGIHCDGQVLVLHDMLGIYEHFAPRHARRYAEIGKTMQEAIAAYADDVRSGRFPGNKESIG
jgi:3-methyl-2-oxobutanoate hydroxymethyltransferase